MVDAIDRQAVLTYLLAFANPLLENFDEKHLTLHDEKTGRKMYL